MPLCTNVCYYMVCGFGYRCWFYDQTAIKRLRSQPMCSEITSNISPVYKHKTSLVAWGCTKLIWMQLMERWKDRRDGLSRCVVSKLLRASKHADAPRYVAPVRATNWCNKCRCFMARSHVLHWRWLSLSRRGGEWGRNPQIWMRGKGGWDLRVQLAVG